MARELTEHPDLNWYPNGQSALQGALLKLHRRLDEKFVEISKKYSSQEHRFPIFIPAAELHKVDYFRSFPHLATFPVTLEDSTENLSHFSETDSLCSHGELQLTKTTPVKDVLTPAACYHFYVHFQKQDVPEARYLTTLAHCFRREKYYAPLERQWSFSMREIVCIGTSEEVQSFLESGRGEVVALIDSLGLPIQWEAASDPFFNPSKNPKFLLQKLQPNKTEMIFDQRLAVGSVNFHRNYFGDSFGISRNDQPAYSGCIAFGLERWVSAILNHFGFEPENWPESLR